MNHNINLQCEVCRNVVRLKVYGGYELKNPFAYSCPECNVTISGYLIWNQDLEEGFIKEFKCKNARVCKNEGNESHILQLATEFFTDKIKKINLSDPTMYFSPFMMDNSPFELRQKKISFVKYVTRYFEENSLTTFRLWELYKNKNYKYLNRQLLLNEFVEKVPLGKVLKVDYPSKIIEVLYNPFLIFLTESGYNRKLSELRKIFAIAKRDFEHEVIELRKDLNNLIIYSDENIIYLLKNFTEYYRNIWPIILSDIYKIDDINEIKKQKGILTTNFEYLKNYYVEAFEILSSLLPLFLGLQNILLRGSRNIFEGEISRNFAKIKSIIDYDKKVVNKGNKIKYFENENIFSNIFDVKTVLDNSIRNSIGHHSYTYEADTQLIKFKDRNKEWSLYLIEFGNLLFKTFYVSFAALEIVMFFNNIE